MIAGDIDWQFRSFKQKYQHRCTKASQKQKCWLSYYKATWCPNKIIVFWQNITRQPIKLVSGSSLVTALVGWSWVVMHRFSFFCPTQRLEVNSGPVDSH